MYQQATGYLKEVIHRHKQGEATGVYSICSSHPVVMRSAMEYAWQKGKHVLIETTCNQVNQYGGYTGHTPSSFVESLISISKDASLPPGDILLGGDHLGPYPWRDQPSETAMKAACEMVRRYVEAGFTKLHLDASMHCADDDHRAPLSAHVIAERIARLAKVAEQTSQSLGLRCVYVIGSEVPAPGGEVAAPGELKITTVADVAETIAVTQASFIAHGLAEAWERTIAVVVQPGVEYGDQAVIGYQRQKAAALSRFIESHARLIYEAHSTDYQTAHALRSMVEDHFAILKVGPELTYAYRTAIFGLEQIEIQMARYLPAIEPSGLSRVIDEVMRRQPQHWQSYYPSDDANAAFARQFSFSDRMRYYWPDRSVQAAIRKLFENLGRQKIPLSLVNQYLPIQYQKVRDGSLAHDPAGWVRDYIHLVLMKYDAAVGNGMSPRLGGDD